MYHLQQSELERQARRERLVGVAVRARLKNRRAERESRALRHASDAVGGLDGRLGEARSTVRTVR